MKWFKQQNMCLKDEELFLTQPKRSLFHKNLSPNFKVPVDHAGIRTITGPRKQADGSIHENGLNMNHNDLRDDIVDPKHRWKDNTKQASTYFDVHGDLKNRRNIASLRVAQEKINSFNIEAREQFYKDKKAGEIELDKLAMNVDKKLLGKSKLNEDLLDKHFVGHSLAKSDSSASVPFTPSPVRSESNEIPSVVITRNNEASGISVVLLPNNNKLDNKTVQKLPSVLKKRIVFKNPTPKRTVQALLKSKSNEVLVTTSRTLSQDFPEFESEEKEQQEIHRQRTESHRYHTSEAGQQASLIEAEKWRAECVKSAAAKKNEKKIDQITSRSGLLDKMLTEEVENVRGNKPLQKILKKVMKGEIKDIRDFKLVKNDAGKFIAVERETTPVEKPMLKPIVDVSLFSDRGSYSIK